MIKKSLKNILWLKEISHQDVSLVGGKNASLGEMYNNFKKKKINVPNGFATTTKAYLDFFEEAGLKDKIANIFAKLDVNNIKNLQTTGQQARKLILKATLPISFQEEILENYHKLSKEYQEKYTDVAVRSSATTAGLSKRSLAAQHIQHGQQETYLNIKGDQELITTIKKCFASLFTDRAIAYREEAGFPRWKIALSVGIQKMVRSDLGAAGVMFTLDTESGFSDLVLINSAFGLGEMLVRGRIIPDEFYVFKPTLKQGHAAIIKKKLGNQQKKLVYGQAGVKEISLSKNQKNTFSLSEEEIITLAKWGCLIEDYYSRLNGQWTPEDIEWAKDGKTNQLFIVQVRPETVYRGKKKIFYEEYKLETKEKSILEGIAIGGKIATGRTKIIKNVSALSKFKPGEILVAKMTDPDWVSIMKQASAIITDEGSKTCHAVIVSRELGIPCLVGTRKATKVLKNGQKLTVDCSSSPGRVFFGEISHRVKRYDLEKIPKVKPKILVNIGTPDLAFKESFLPVEGAGLVREEFIIAQEIKIHPLALYHFNKLPSNVLKKAIDNLSRGYKNKKLFFVEKLSQGVGQIAAAFYPKPVIVRFSDFKTNEYKGLKGGDLFEKEEHNPMLGWRGASRYYSLEFKPAFKMECAAIKKARDEFGLTNIAVMVPFCRTVEEGEKVLQLMKQFGLEKGKNKLKVYVMAEVPSNIISGEKFLDIFDGFSIGSNDLTQLTLGLDRDSALIAKIGNEKNDAVKKLIVEAIKLCRKRNKYSGICGEAPSNFPSFVEFLAKEGIQSISVAPDAVVRTIFHLAKKGFIVK